MEVICDDMPYLYEENATTWRGLLPVMPRANVARVAVALLAFLMKTDTEEGYAAEGGGGDGKSNI